MKQKGFTLIELMLVVTLIAISVGVTSDVILSLIRSYNKTSVMNEIEQESNFIGLKLEKELKNATNVNVPSATQLSFTYGTDTVYYHVNTTTHNLYRSTTSFNEEAIDNALVATSTINQTAGGVNVSCDSGVCFSLVGTNPQVVGISMIFNQSGGGGVSFKGEVNLKNTVVIRNTY